jgi:hypothetical protein
MTMFDDQQAWFMLGCIVRLGMAAIFALAAADSLRDWPSYGAIVVEYRIVPRPVALSAARVLPLLEVLAAGLLLVGAPPGALLGLALMAVFTAAVGINLWRGRVDIDCGCGAAAGQRLSWSLLLRNLLLTALLAGASVAPCRGRLDVAAMVGILGGTFFLVTAYFTANQLLTNRQRLAAA